MRPRLQPGFARVGAVGLIHRRPAPRGSCQPRIAGDARLTRSAARGLGGWVERVGLVSRGAGVRAGPPPATPAARSGSRRRPASSPARAGRPGRAESSASSEPSPRSSTVQHLGVRQLGCGEQLEPLVVLVDLEPHPRCQHQPDVGQRHHPGLRLVVVQHQRAPSRPRLWRATSSPARLRWRRPASVYRRNSADGRPGRRGERRAAAGPRPGHAGRSVGRADADQRGQRVGVGRRRLVVQHLVHLDEQVREQAALPSSSRARIPRLDRLKPRATSRPSAWSPTARSPAAPRRAAPCPRGRRARRPPAPSGARPASASRTWPGCSRSRTGTRRSRTTSG